MPSRLDEVKDIAYKWQAHAMAETMRADKAEAVALRLAREIVALWDGFNDNGQNTLVATGEVLAEARALVDASKEQHAG